MFHQKEERWTPVLCMPPAREVAVPFFLLFAFLVAACNSTRRTASNGSYQIKDPAVLEQRADSLFFAAERSKMLGDYRTAITQFSDYLRLKKDNPTVYYELSRLFIEVRNPKYALGFARRATGLDTANKWFRITLADAFGVNGMFDSAVVVYDGLVRRYPDNDEYLFNKGILLAKADRITEALKVFDELEQKAGVVEELVYQKQRLLLKQSKVDAAAAEIRKLIDMYPGEMRYYLLLGDIYDANERIMEATAVYDTVLQSDPVNPRALIALSGYAKKKGR